MIGSNFNALKIFYHWSHFLFSQDIKKTNNEVRVFNFSNYLMNKKKTDKETKNMYPCTTKDTVFK